MTARCSVGIPLGAIGDRARRPAGGVEREFPDTLDQLFAPLPPSDQIGDRNLLEAELSGEGGNLGPAHHGAIVVDELGQHADRRELRQPAEIHSRLGVSGAHEDAAFAGDQREDVAGADEILRTRIGIGERPDGGRALLGRNAGGGAMAEIDRDGEGGAVRRVVVGDHRHEVEPPRRIAGERSANDAAGVADQEGELLGSGMDGGEDEVSLVFAVVVVGDHDDLAVREGAHGVADPVCCHCRQASHSPQPI